MTSSFSITRACVGEASESLVFVPPINSPELVAALEISYPKISSHKERMQKAVLDFFIDEQRQFVERQLRRQQLMEEHHQLECQKLELDKKCRELKQAIECVPDVSVSVQMPQLPLPTAESTTSASSQSSIHSFPEPSLDDILNFDVDTSLPVNVQSDLGFVNATDPSSTWLNSLSGLNGPVSSFDTTSLLFDPINISPTDSFETTPKSTPALEFDHDMFDFLSDTACVTPAIGSTLTGPEFSNYFFDAATSQALLPQMPLFFDSNPGTVESALLPSPQVPMKSFPVQVAVTAQDSTPVSAPAPSSSTSAFSADPEQFRPVPQMEAFTSVWSLSPNSQPKRRTRRTMTDTEKKDYRVKRQNGACGDCRRRRRKCTHPISASISPRTPAFTLASPSSQSIPTPVGVVSPQQQAQSASSLEHIFDFLTTPGSEAGSMFTTSPLQAIATGTGASQAFASNDNTFTLGSTPVFADGAISIPSTEQAHTAQQPYRFVAHDPLSWSDPGLFSMDSDDQGWDNLISLSGFQAYDGPPWVSQGYAPQSNFRAPTQSQAPNNLSQPWSTNSRPRSHHLMQQQQSTLRNPQFSRLQTLTAPLSQVHRINSTNSNAERRTSFDSHSRIDHTAIPALPLAPQAPISVPLSPQARVTSAISQSSIYPASSSSGLFASLPQKLESSQDRMLAPALKPIQTVSTTPLPPSSSQPYSLRSSMNRWRYTQPQSTLRSGDKGPTASSSSRGLGSMTKWRSNSNNQNIVNNSNSNNSESGVLPAKLRVMRPTLPISLKPNSEVVSASHDAARIDAEIESQSSFSSGDFERLAIVSLISVWSELVQNLKISRLSRSTGVLDVGEYTSVDAPSLPFGSSLPISLVA